jgi:hypothetical protein
MIQRVCAIFLLALGVQAVCQTGLSNGTGGGAQMQTPPMVSGQAYPTEVGTEARSNYLSGGISFQTAFDDNVLGASTSKPVSDVSYTILPTITFNQSTARQRRILSYSPGFTFYNPTSALNQATQSVTGSYQYRLTEHITFFANESFQKSSNVFSQAESVLGEPITGSAQSQGVVAPFANMISNNTSGNVSYQFSRDSLIGGTGAYSKQSYPNPSEAVGLSNSDSSSGSVYYNRRLSREQHIGIEYQYVRSLAELPAQGQSKTQTQTISAFYAIYFTPAFSISFSGGPQYIDSAQPGPLKNSASWEPAGNAAIGWQGRRTSFTAGFGRSVMEVPGLFGAQESTTGNGSARWRASQNWFLGCSGNYGVEKSIGPVSTLPTENGHTISGVVSAGRSFRDGFELNFGYDRMHESFSGITTIANAPNSDRVYGTLSYRFTRPLGR